MPDSLKAKRNLRTTKFDKTLQLTATKPKAIVGKERLCSGKDTNKC